MVDGVNLKEKLYAKFENVRSRRGRGGDYPYISSKDVFDRMNTVFGTKWSSQVESQEIVGNNIIVRVRVTITDPDTDRSYVQEGFGAAVNDDRLEAGSPFKAAYSKALKAAVRMWGVGLYLEEDEEPISAEHASSTTTVHNPPAAIKQPPATVLPNKVQPEISTPPTIRPSALDDTLREMQEAPKTEMVTPEIKTQKGLPTPPSVMMSSTKQGLPPKPELPKTKLPENKPMPSKTNTINTGEPDYISDVQKAALHSILAIKGVEYEALAREAFELNGIVKESIPAPDKLTYQEAVYVVKLGNDKFRKH